MQGRCRFGNQCRNAHPYGGAQAAAPQQANPVHFAQMSHGFAQPAQPTPLGSTGKSGAASASGKMDKISERIVAWRRSKWIFSCLARDPATSNVDGFMDFSPERVRMEAYQGKNAEVPRGGGGGKNSWYSYSETHTF